MATCRNNYITQSNVSYYNIPVLILLLISPAVWGQALTKEQSDLLRKNTSVICSDKKFSEPDWKPVADNIGNSNMILLGEFNHGSKEIFQLRNSLIKYLHKNKGIKAILFESGIGELILADIKKNEMTPAQMTNGLFGGWRTKEFTELMDYIKTEQIDIAGFDIQRSGGSFAICLRQLAMKLNIDSTLYNDFEARYGLLNAELTNKKAVWDSVKDKAETLISDYRSLHLNLVKQIDNSASKELLFTARTIENRIKFLSYMLAFVKDKNWNNRWAARDSAMADNVHWLIENFYKNQPVIIVGHNYHIARFNEKESTMGEILGSWYDKVMFSIGVFAGAGSFNNNFAKEEQMLPPDSTGLDIKHIITSLPGNVNFITVNKNNTAFNTWLNTEIIVNDTFIDLSNNNKMILSECFDGILLIDKVSPPSAN